MRFGGYHPKLAAFMGQCERKISEECGRDWPYLTPEEVWFLEEIWGRVSHYDFTHLEAGFPLEGYTPRDYCTYFVYHRARKTKRPIVFEVLDYRSCNLQLSAAEYSELLERKERLEGEGFIVVRIVKTDSRYETNDARDLVLRALSRSEI
ncbi:hypothetical protein [Paenibacillus alkalitolerans]|uniref:hypothetical protein n=1 Tax=Paenibacillus alkalitolerans TaxID=2799335 RepID=UPI0018F5F5B4|nr:hypothetical protein [Paenibacillus alkalitolerans]